MSPLIFVISFILLLRRYDVPRSLDNLKVKYFDNNYLVDTAKKEAFSFRFDVNKIPLMLESHVDIFFTINRRKGCFQRSIQYLKDLITKGEEIMTISYILHKLVEHYEKAKASNKELFQNTANLIPGNVEIVHNGYNIITPNDLHNDIFLPISQDEVTPTFHSSNI